MVNLHIEDSLSEPSALIKLKLKNIIQTFYLIENTL